MKRVIHMHLNPVEGRDRVPVLASDSLRTGTVRRGLKMKTVRDVRGLFGTRPGLERRALGLVAGLHLGGVKCDRARDRWDRPMWLRTVCGSALAPAGNQPTNLFPRSNLSRKANARQSGCNLNESPDVGGLFGDAIHGRPFVKRERTAKNYLTELGS